MPSISPTKAQLEQLNTIPDDGPLVMVNLLRFKTEEGKALYGEYAQQTREILQRIGAKVLYYGTDSQTFIGDDTWDVILLVQYPSRSVFVQMITDPEYLAGSEYRTRALEDSRLYITRPRFA